jgi:single-strand selective monofunctional uracil DNA glycosylase
VATNKPVGENVRQLIEAGRRLCSTLERLRFGAPVAHVYNPLRYAREPYEAYLRTYAGGRKHVLFLGMNPGPFGMVQTGIPFGEVTAVRDWLGITGDVISPAKVHPKRPVSGFACLRSEVSGRRLWGLFADEFQTASRFFSDHLVINYCPLAFVEATGRNRTPDKIPPGEQTSVFAACDEHLQTVVAVSRPEWLIGVGDFAWRRIREVFPSGAPRCGRILHPSPASPAANRDWAGTARKQLRDLGVW